MTKSLSLRNRSKSRAHSIPDQEGTHLILENLEPRMMLSTVSIFASGQTGEESMKVFAGGDTRIFNNISTEGEVFVFETEERIDEGLISIEFTNDLYAPEQGIDRNLTVEKIVVDGVTFATDDPFVYAEGVWDPVLGQIVGGTGLGLTLHTNGFFDFFIDGQEVDGIDFGGARWNVVEGFGTASTLSTSNNGSDLNISGIFGPLAVSTKIDVAQGSIYNLSFTSKRHPIAGQFTSDSRPWATVGIDYYDSAGNLITQATVDVNSTRLVANELELEVPETTASAYAWIWIDEFNEGVEIPLTIGDFSIEAIDVSNDVTPPTAELSPFSFSTPFRNEIDFGVEFRDDFRLQRVTPGVITVTGPNGFSQEPFIATGGPNNTDSFRLLVFGLLKPFGNFDATDNGTYTVTLVDNQLFDFAGNVAPGQVLGTFEIKIPDNNSAS